MNGHKWCDYIGHNGPGLLQDLIPLGFQGYNLVAFGSRYGCEQNPHKVRSYPFGVHHDLGDHIGIIQLESSPFVFMG